MMFDSEGYPTHYHEVLSATFNAKYLFSVQQVNSFNTSMQSNRSMEKD